MYQSAHTSDLAPRKKSVNQQWFKYESSYWAEIFRRCSSSVCAKLTKKFLPLLNQPASHGPFRPKLWTALATAFVGIFFRKKFWWGSGPIPVGHWKEFWISWKKRRFQIFQKLAGPSNNDVHVSVYAAAYICFIFCLPKNCSSMDRQAFEKFENAIFFTIFKIPFNGPLV